MSLKGCSKTETTATAPIIAEGLLIKPLPELPPLLLERTLLNVLFLFLLANLIPPTVFIVLIVLLLVLSGLITLERDFFITLTPALFEVLVCFFPKMLLNIAFL